MKNANIDLVKIYKELKLLNKKISHLEQMLIPEEEMTVQDKKDLEGALKDHKEGKTVKFRDIIKD